MATLKVTKAAVVLSARDQAKLSRSITELTLEESKQRAREARENFARRKRIRTMIDQSLTEAEITGHHAMRSRLAKDFARFDTACVERARGNREAARKRSRGSPNAVWGLSSGVDVPRYDFAWTNHDVDGSPNDFASSADSGSGHLRTYAHCHDSSPKRVDSWAGVGFWYVPNRSGFLTVSTSPSISESLWTGADWNDVGQAGGWITLGIASYLRDPFAFVRWETIKTDQLWWNEDNWFDFTTHKQDIAAHSMSAQAIGDTSHYYACWCWIHSYAYAENGGSYGGSDLRVDVRSFTYGFF